MMSAEANVTKPVVVMRTVNTALSPELVETFKDSTVVGFGIQGVDLGRSGEISLLQLTEGETGRVFLLDVAGLKLGDEENELLAWVKKILESESVLKVMHDCRMGSDALFHELGIELRNVHDVACWHALLRGESEYAPIKTVCSEHGLVADPGPVGRDYLLNHKLWAKRPLTGKLAAWGAKDAGNVLAVYRLQLAEASEEQATLARAQVVASLDVLRGAQMGTVCVGGRKLGGFIGRGGSGIRALQKSSNTRLYPRGVRSEGTFTVYFRDAAGFEAVKKSI